MGRCLFIKTFFLENGLSIIPLLYTHTTLRTHTTDTQLACFMLAGRASDMFRRAWFVLLALIFLSDLRPRMVFPHTRVVCAVESEYCAITITPPFLLGYGEGEASLL